MPGPSPKSPSKRRRVNKPKSYGAAEPVTAPAADATSRQLGIDDPHPLVVDLWDAVQSSCEARFYSEADWARLRMELWHANRVMSGGQLSSRAWVAVQHGLTELLISPAAKRRAAIEVRPVGPDADEDAAVSMTAKYRTMLKSV